MCVCVCVCACVHAHSTCKGLFVEPVPILCMKTSIYHTTRFQFRERKNNGVLGKSGWCVTVALISSYIHISLTLSHSSKGSQGNDE